MLSINLENQENCIQSQECAVDMGSDDNVQIPMIKDWLVTINKIVYCVKTHDDKM